MEQFKRVKVVMLSTKVKETSIIMLGVVPNHSVLTKTVLDDIHDWMKFGKPQHLYIISDDEIKEGDWVTDGTEIWKAGKGYSNQEKIKKIIATTDTSLLISVKSITTPEGVKVSIHDKLLPQPSQQFINKYIEEYNKGNIITDVLVEYHNNYDLHYYTPPGGIECCEKIDNWQLKINPKDNTITIKKVKDSWNREEVIEFGNKVREYCKNIHKEDSLHKVFFEWDKWIEENL